MTSISTTPQKALIVLTADKDMEFAVRGILGRFKSLGIQEVAADFRVHPEHDPGCLLRGHDFLKPLINQYDHALLLLDREGSGQEIKSRVELEAEIESRLSQAGWGDRAAAIVIDPELEMWVWSDSPHVDTILGWQGKEPDLRTWLFEKGYLSTGVLKPPRPKEALEEALRAVKAPKSSSTYSRIAQKVSISSCIDPSFLKLKDVLQLWFRTSDNLT